MGSREKASQTNVKYTPFLSTDLRSVALVDDLSSGDGVEHFGFQKLGRVVAADLDEVRVEHRHVGEHPGPESALDIFFEACPRRCLGVSLDRVFYREALVRVPAFARLARQGLS